MALATPTQTYASLDGQGPGSERAPGGASASLVAQALQQASSASITSNTANASGSTGNSGGRPGLANREADGGWCLSWCKDRYWGEVLAVGCGTGGWVKVGRSSDYVTG